MAERDVIINLVVKGGDNSAQQLEKVAQSEQDVAVSAGQATKALDAQTKELNENNDATKQLIKQQQTLKDRLKEIKLELQKLALAGKQNTEEYKRLKAEGGNLVGVLGDVNDELRQAGSDTRGLDKAIRVATTATAAFGLVQGAAALFGDENEELQKSLLKVNAALTVLTSLQQIQEELSRKDSVITSLAAKAKAAYAAATAGATGALGAFRVALIATGIGAAVVAIGLLIANWDKLRDAIFGASNALDDYNKQREIDQKKSKAQSDINNAEIATLEAKARLLRSEGKIAEATLTDQAVLNAKVREAERLLNEEKDNQIKLEEKLAPAIAKRTQEIKRQIVAAENNTESFRGNTKSVAQLEKELRNVSQTIRNEYKPEIDEANIALDAAQTAYDNAKAAANEYNNELRDKALEERTKRQEEANKAAAAARKELEELNALLAKTKKETKDVFAPVRIDDPFAPAKGSAEDLQNQISKLQSELSVLAPTDPNFNAYVIAIEKLKKELETLEATAQTARDSLDLTKVKAPKEDNASEDAFFAEQERIKKIKKEIEEEKNFRLKAAAEIGNGTIELFKKTQEIQAQILQNRLNQGLITEEEYQKELAKIRRREAIATKIQSVFNATLQVFEAFGKALAFSGNPIYAAFVKGLALSNLAAAVSFPIPKFRKGGDVDILKGGRERLGELFGNSHERGGILIEAEGGEHITRKSMAKKYRPLLHAINSDTVDTFLKPNTMAMPMHKRLSSSEIKSSRQAEKRMAELIEEVRFLSQYVRQGNKYAKVTADNTQDLKTAKKYHRV